MLVTISGMVGSGKSTVAARIVRHFEQAGVEVQTLRFQTLPCFALLRTSVKPDARSSHVRKNALRPTPARWVGYKRQRLTAFAALVYAARIVAFRAYTLSWPRRRVYVLDRYFYDNFAHYSVDTARERLYYAAIRALIPRPDVAIVLSADVETITARCPDYSREYVTQVRAAYDVLRVSFPNLVHAQTDREPLAADRLVSMLDGRIAAAR